MDLQPTLLVGRVSEIGPTFVMLGSTRVDLCVGEETLAAFHLGHSIAVMALAADGRFIDGKIVPTCSLASGPN